MVALPELLRARRCAGIPLERTRLHPPSTRNGAGARGRAHVRGRRRDRLRRSSTAGLGIPAGRRGGRIDRRARRRRREPEPFNPVIRGHAADRRQAAVPDGADHRRARASARRSATSRTWSPPSKISSKYLAPTWSALDGAAGPVNSAGERPSAAAWRSATTATTAPAARPSWAAADAAARRQARDRPRRPAPARADLAAGQPRGARRARQGDRRRAAARGRGLDARPRARRRDPRQRPRERADRRGPAPRRRARSWSATSPTHACTGRSAS